MDLTKIMEYLKKNSWIIYIPVIIPIALFLNFIGTCLSPLLVAITIFGIPYLLGVRDAKMFLKTGTLILLVTGILFGGVYTYFMFNQEYYFEPKLISDGPLEEGTVTPYLGNENTSFNYTVTYTGLESWDDITIYVNITDWAGENKKDIPLKYINGSNGLYYNETVLGKSGYYYSFTIRFDDDTWFERSDENFGFGPITTPYSEILSNYLLQGVFMSFMNAGLMFYVILAMFWLSRKSKEEKMKMEEDWGDKKEETGKEKGKEKEPGVREQVKEEFECTACGADVDADAERCPSCGEGFEDDYEVSEKEQSEGSEKKEAIKVKKEVYTCSACGADVDDDATKCWKCGEGFDDDDENE